MKPLSSNPFRAQLATLAALLIAPLASAADGTWLGNTGNWNAAGTWSGGTIADGADFTANFTGIDIVATPTITLGENRTIGNITFTDATTPSHDLLITGNTLTLDRAPTFVPVIDVTQTGRTLTIASVVTGTDGLQKNGAGNLTLSAKNTFTGPLNINGGALEFSNNDAATRNVYLSTQININNGATLRVSGSAGNIEMYNGRNYTFDAGGGGSILVGIGNYNSGTAAFSITTNGGARNNIGLISTSGAFGFNVGTGAAGVTFDVALGSDATSDLTVTPIIANSAPILKTGAGRLTFTATNTYSGTTTISAGTLIANSSAALGNASATNTLIFTGGTLQAGGTITSAASRKVTLTSTGIINTNGNTVSIAGIISGAGGLTKTGAGDMNLTGANTYNGLTMITAGRIAVAAANNLSSGATGVVQSGTGQLYINSGATINNPFNISTIGYSEAGDSQNNVTGAIRLSGSTLSGPITLSGNSRISAAVLVPGFLFNTISGKITGAYGIDIYGFQTTSNAANVFTLSNTGNDYTGDTTIYNSNFNSTNLTNVTTTLRLGASNVIPDVAGGGNVVFAINGTNNNGVVELDLNGFIETINGLTVNADTFTKRITNSATGASVLTIGANDTTSSFSGTITDAGAGKTLAITKIGTGNLTLSSTSNFIGGTAIDGGTLTLGHATNTLANGGAVNVNGGTLALGTNTDTVGAVTLTSGSITGTGAGTLTGSSYDVRSGSVSAILAGSSVVLTKTTAGIVTLSGANSYTGATNVELGTLVINGDQSSATGNVSVTGILAGNGGTIGGNTTINAGGRLAMGDGTAKSIGTGTFTGTLAFVGTSIFEWDLDAPNTIQAGSNLGSYDQVVNNNVTKMSGTSVFNVVLGTGDGFADAFWDTDKTWTNIFSGTGLATDLSAIFTSFSGTGIVNNAGVGEVAGRGSFSFNSSTTLTWTAVPEPTSALAGLLITAGLLRRRRSA